MPHIVRICQLVEGMPLGVELAAAWVRARPCEEIALEIEQNLDVLTTRLRDVPERHRSVRATFEHSWQLLSDAERALVARLSIFRGGFQGDAAALVAGASASLLSALLDKSLIRRVSSDRHDMHGLLRQYAAEKLQANPQELEDTQWQHARYFASFLGQQEAHLKGARQKQALLEIALLLVEQGRVNGCILAKPGFGLDSIEMLDSCIGLVLSAESNTQQVMNI